MAKEVDHKQRVLKILQDADVGVIATASKNGVPEAAIVSIRVTDDFEIIFSTLINSRKYANLNKNPQVAFVIGGWDNDVTVQLEGTARELKGKEEQQYSPLDFKLEKVFKFKPSWLRYRNYQVGAQNDIEITF